MKRSANRILTTHVGSLARPKDLLEMMDAKLRGKPHDNETYVTRVRSAVAEVVRKQVECGVDDVPDGEQGKASFNAYDEPCMRRASSGVCYIYFNNFHVCNAVSVFEVGARRNYLPGHLYSREVRED